MKLKAKQTNQATRTEKLQLRGELVLSVDAYAKYYEITYQNSITIPELLSEMINAFMKSDRAFSKWYKEQLDSKV